MHIKYFDELILQLFFQEKVIKVDLENGFTLKNGEKSPVFFDSEALESAERRDWISSAFAMALSNETPDAFIGVVGGGVSWASSLAGSRLKPLLRARAQAKNYGLYNQIGGNLPFDGAKVVVIDDVITSGDNIIKVVNALRAGKDGKHAEVVGVYVIFDWDFPAVNEKFAQAGIKKTHLFSFRDVLDFGKMRGCFSEEEIDALEKFYKEQKQ